MDLGKFREILSSERERILEILKAEKENDVNTNDQWTEPKDPEDLANLTLSDDIRTKICEREYHTLREIEEALVRINSGKYGICEKCGKFIEEERLELIPWTRYCSACSKVYTKDR
ncbi:MAG TPA: TraR/DksA C4-type zinc finger protein [Candidatus Hydrothermia bacterium]|nr:TraR/DksA C4-type zinc finger protein [Candidatus Hydrothermae bacterium]MDD3649768.1 TraR/DksA C4-type zinc finger protein [Candidatus Hydrothermia bacterium]MDD5573273.1 TraR/DksA C4-type zinc finger protein [Candidatus Hydrothermia bacterium]HOK23701.1 TraR/DksA C4-type zinc finger protein [Candidatus Hydrothermia bacterium]HOL24410.1 TraR/DksA C4-type zinc finger protein [Candidatus Hydrothermia bacterium]